MANAVSGRGSGASAPEGSRARRPRVAVASCHDKRNYGSMLQAWATQEALSAMGADAVTIDKRGLAGDIAPGRRRYYLEHALDASLYRSKLGFAGHRLRQRLDRGFGARIAERQAAFDAFEREMFRLSPHVGSLEGLVAYVGGFDAVLVGSDQLWLPVNIAGGYFTLSWVPDGVPRVAYATSFGVSSLASRDAERARGFLPGLSAVSVREESGADIVEGLTGFRPAVVCDPTMLLDAEEWRKLAVGAEPPCGEPYVLCYFLGRNAWNRRCAVELARREGCRVVAYLHNDEYVSSDEGYADLAPYGAGPAEFVSAVANAAYVCTDSFHGTVFSSMLGTPFFSFRRHESAGAQSTNSRLDTLLGRLGLEGRLCESPRAFEAACGRNVDFGEVSARIGKYRRESRRWLASALGLDAVEGALSGCAPTATGKASAGVSSPGSESGPPPASGFAWRDSASPRHIMVNDKVHCCGCAACANACPRGAIAMEPDEEGCDYPGVDAGLCVECGACVRVCPVLDAVPEKPRPQRAFVVQHEDPEILLESTSGGAFTAIAEQVIARGGIVFGFGYDGEGEDGLPEVRCFGVETAEGLARFRNSKYVQGRIGGAYREVEACVDSGREVLFSGAPCQVEGLRRFLGGKSRGCGMADVVCRAAPCRSVFAAYRRWLEARTGRHAEVVRFRDKRRFGYRYSSICAFEEGCDRPFYSAGVESDPYLRAFFGNFSDRPSCHACAFKKRYRESDLTLWDCFGVRDLAPELDDNRGATRVLVHSERGQELLNDARGRARVVEIDPDLAVADAFEMTCSTPMNPRRPEFMHDVAELPGAEVMDKWFPDTARVKTERAARLACEHLGIYDPVKRMAKRLAGKR